MSVRLGAMTLPFRGYSSSEAEGAWRRRFKFVCIGLPHEGRGVPHQDDEAIVFRQSVAMARQAGLDPVMYSASPMLTSRGANWPGSRPSSGRRMRPFRTCCQSEP